MTSWSTISRRLLALACFLAVLNPPTASACSVCFGDAESPLAKGAVAGVLVLGAVVYFLVLGFVGFGVFWYVRARRMSQPSEADV